MTTRRGWKSASELVTRIEADYGIKYEADTVRVWRGRGVGFKAEWAVQIGRQWIYDERAVLAWVVATKRHVEKKTAR